LGYFGGAKAPRFHRKFVREKRTTKNARIDDVNTSTARGCLMGGIEPRKCRGLTHVAPVRNTAAVYRLRAGQAALHVSLRRREMEPNGPRRATHQRLP